MADPYYPDAQAEWDAGPVYERPEWHKYAMCRGMHFTEPNLFFPEKGDYKAIRDAKKMCLICPVRQQCASVGIWETHGIWGGITERNRRGQRRAIPMDQRPSKAPRVRVTAVCGTVGGYKRHLRLEGTPVKCADCLAANNRYQAEQKRIRLARQRYATP